MTPQTSHVNNFVLLQPHISLITDGDLRKQDPEVNRAGAVLTIILHPSVIL